MSRLRKALAAVWDFIVGDDWRAAAGVVLALAAVALLEAAGVEAWWVLPPCVVLVLVLSIRREARRAQAASAGMRPPAANQSGAPT